MEYGSSHGQAAAAVVSASARPSCGGELGAGGLALGTGQGRPESPCIPPDHSEGERQEQQASHGEEQQMVGVVGEGIG